MRVRNLVLILGLAGALAACGGGGGGTPTPASNTSSTGYPAQSGPATPGADAYPAQPDQSGLLPGYPLETATPTP